jgi:hypothetical protein
MAPAWAGSSPARRRPAAVTGEDLRRAERTAAYAANRPGYQVLQATRPQTISYALTDSPAGQLAWIAEKFTEWTDPASTIDDDVLLTDVSIYWFTRTAGSSARLAKESGYGAPCPVPMGVAVPPPDIVLPVRPLAERRFDIRHWTELPRGGHFAALEVPADLAADIRAFFRLRLDADGSGSMPTAPARCRRLRCGADESGRAEWTACELISVAGPPWSPARPRASGWRSRPAWPPPARGWRSTAGTARRSWPPYPTRVTSSPRRPT